MSSFIDALRASPHTAPIALDGGLGTRLATRGNDVSSELWSAEVLQHHPEEVLAAHYDFFRAGARVATTCSYQVSYEGFARAGFSVAEVDRLLDLSVKLAQQARTEAGLHAENAWVLASVGPYGASLGDGSEYTGDYGPDYGVDALRKWHRARLRRLAQAGADALICETIPSLTEGRALALELDELQAPAILSFTVDDGVLRSGESIVEAARIAHRAENVIAVGVNCSDALHATAALRQFREETDLPLVVYPNSGEHWNAQQRSWSGEAATLEHRVDEWVSLGARLVGGCCRVDTEGIARLAAQLDSGANR